MPGRIASWVVVVALACCGDRPALGGGGADGAWLDSELGSLRSLYEHLHAHPELSFREVETARTVARELREAGCEVAEGVGGTGVVGVLRNGEGPTVLVRTDLDALPVTEQTGLPYASQVRVHDDANNEVGVMHACGHDMHMSVLVGTARWLGGHRTKWRGTVVFVGQPAEEKVSGARAMLADGLYTRFPMPDHALALHVASDLEAGMVGHVSGPMLASSTSVDVTVRGKGGHGAGPHETIDPIVLASLLVLDFQSIVSREIKPIDPAVVTVGSIHGGTKHNIIPESVALQLTLRAYREEVRQALLEGIRRRAHGLAVAHRAPEPEVVESESTPPTVNTPALVERVLPAIRAAIGDARVVPREPLMGAEDFGLYSEGGVPIFMFWLGSVSPDVMARAKEAGEPPPSAHSPRFAPDPDPTLRTGIQAMTAAVAALCPPA